MKIYPNPSDGIFTIYFNSFENENTRVEIFSLRGEKIYNISNPEMEEVINITDYTNGIYLVKITTNDETETFKIIKK